MGEVFFISDTHMGHKNILNFEDDAGDKIRPGFRDVHEMNARIMENWMRVVGPHDKIYHLGDVAFTLEGLRLLKALPGKKRLVMGNHDQFALREYTDIFEKIYGVKQMEGFWLTHVPMERSSVNGDRVKGNIHGHLHKNLVGIPGYFNACVEHIDYTPVPFGVIKEKFSA